MVSAFRNTFPRTRTAQPTRAGARQAAQRSAAPRDQSRKAPSPHIPRRAFGTLRFAPSFAFGLKNGRKAARVPTHPFEFKSTRPGTGKWLSALNVSIRGTGVHCMRYERAYARRQRAVTFAGATRTVTIPLQIPDFERLERLATEHNVGNATLVRHIIREYLKRKAKND
jgi:hypothetical protein